jgi:hypothetical protein
VSAEREIPEPREVIYLPRSSWAPAFFAAGVGALICGIFANGFIFPAPLYSLVGVVFVIAALRSLIAGAVRDYYRLPRRQAVRGAVLPLERLGPPAEALIGPHARGGPGAGPDPDDVSHREHADQL